MTCIASPAAHRICRGMRKLDTGPTAGRLVAGLAHRRASVGAGVRLGCQAEGGSGVACCTASGDRYAAVETRRQPAGVATLVAAHTTCRGRDVRGRLAGGVAAVMATGAVGGRGEGAVIGLGPTPGGGRFVATLATGRGGNVVTRLAGGT